MPTSRHRFGCLRSRLRFVAEKARYIEHLASVDRVSCSQYDIAKKLAWDKAFRQINPIGKAAAVKLHGLPAVSVKLLPASCHRCLRLSRFTFCPRGIRRFRPLGLHFRHPYRFRLGFHRLKQCRFMGRLPCLCQHPFTTGARLGATGTGKLAPR